MTLKTNFIYSSILTTSQYLFPLILYPYISRTLGLSNIGIVNFVDNLINYFIFISMMGIATVGVREIASARNEREKLSKTFSSLCKSAPGRALPASSTKRPGGNSAACRLPPPGVQNNWL